MQNRRDALKKIDCHRHCSYQENDFDALRRSANALEIEKIVLFGHNGVGETGFDDTIWQWYKAYPDLVAPLACDFSYTKQDLVYGRTCLEKGFFGFGELLIGHDGAQSKALHGMQYDDEIPLALFKMAGEYNAFVLAHCNKAFEKSFLRAVQECKETTIIWAHVGYDFSQGIDGALRDAAEIEAHLVQNPNLMFDISFWKKDARCMNTPEYLALLEKYNTRFVWGLDLTDSYAQLQEDWFTQHNVVLQCLSETAQENILYRNMARLLQK